MGPLTAQPAEGTPVTDEAMLALSRTALATDAARRVGWARAFEALARVDALEEDLRQTRDELKYLRRAYSRLLGLIQHSHRNFSPAAQKELAAHFAAEKSFRVQGAWDEGVAIAFVDQAEREDWTPEYAQYRRAARAYWATARSERDAEARRSGHRVQTGRGAPLERSCQCGAGIHAQNRHEADHWREEHMCQAAHGISKQEWLDQHHAVLNGRFPEFAPEQDS